MIFIYEILKIIFLRSSLKNLNFFEKKNKRKNSNFLTVTYCSKVNNNFFEPKKFTINYLYLSSCVGPTSLTISNLFIDNIENTFKGNIII